MAILTKFLKLLKPEKNDYVDVEKHLSENYDKIDTKIEELSNSNDKKLDKGAVSTEYDTAKKIEDKIKEAKKIGDAAKAEADKKLDKGNLISAIQSGEAIFKALQNNTGMKFDKELLYLNDAGTKKVGFCYLDRLTDGIFECIKQTTAVVNDSSSFKNFSNKENSDRLSNSINITSFRKEEILLPGITVSNACSLTIVGNVAYLFLDGIILNDIKSGYNDLIKIPKQYSTISVVDGSFINSRGISEGYVRVFDNKVRLYSPTKTEYSYLTMSIPVKKLY